MAKIKLTKGELKRQRNALGQYERFLPTLQLKKQQLQMEILHQVSLLTEKKNEEQKIVHSMHHWVGLLAEPKINIRRWIIPTRIATETKNIAGVNLPVFNHAEFAPAEYDLFIMPLWVDTAIQLLRSIVSLRETINVLEEGIAILKEELRITAQRVNLFEKIKIPEAEEAIRIIKIYLGDQMANAVGRSKIAKKKIEQAVLEEVFV